MAGRVITVQAIETQGIWLGMTKGDISEYLQDEELRLEAGDQPLRYTDAKIKGDPLRKMGRLACAPHSLTWADQYRGKSC